MGEWKVQMGLRIRQALRVEIEEFAAREHRKLGNRGELLLAWGFAQLKAAGSTPYSLRLRGHRPCAIPS